MIKCQGRRASHEFRREFRGGTNSSPRSLSVPRRIRAIPQAERFAKKSKVKLHMLIGIEEGTIDGLGFGLKEICGLAAGMGITPYRLMLAYESKLKDAEKGTRERARND